MRERLARLAHDVRETESGVACAILQHGDVALHLSPGEDAISEGSVFEIGSITKTMTGLLLAILVDRGAVHLDDPIGTWIDVGRAGTITLEQLATHTSGLPRVTPTMIKRASSTPDNPYRDITADDVLGDLQRVRLRTPGAMLYSNAGYMVLGYVLALAAGASYEDIVRDEIFAPLEMHHANFGDDADPRRLPGYRNGRPTAHWDFQLRGAGGVDATIRDMAAYLAANVDPASTPLAAALVRAQSRLVHHDAVWVGLGWHHNGGAIRHNGGTFGFGSFIGFNPASRAGVVILMNGGHRAALDHFGFGVLAELDSGNSPSG